MLRTVDCFYKSVFLKKFINNLSIGGKYFLVEKSIYQLFKDTTFNNIIYTTTNKIYKYLPICFFFEVLFLCKPLLYVKIWKLKKRGKKKLGKKGKALNTKVIPTNISREKAYNMALHWLVKSIRQQKEKKLKLAILKEFKQILLEFRGATLEKKQEIYRLISINRSFAHFRW
jgi:ribosomal protein S7